MQIIRLARAGGGRARLCKVAAGWAPRDERAPTDERDASAEASLSSSSLSHRASRRGRLAHRHHLRGVQRELACQLAYVVQGRAHVGKGTRPRAAGVLDAAVLHVPGGEPLPPQRVGQGGGAAQGGPRVEAPAVHHHRHRKRPPAWRQPQLAELGGVTPVRAPVLHRTAGELHHLVRRQQAGLLRGERQGGGRRAGRPRGRNGGWRAWNASGGRVVASADAVSIMDAATRAPERISVAVDAVGRAGAAVRTCAERIAGSTGRSPPRSWFR